MPETLNISGYEIINGESYDNNGSIVTAATYDRVDNFIKFQKGNYVFKFIIVNAGTSRTLNFRI